jgi:hypothetical protein
LGGSVSIRIGDAVFVRSGLPTTVKGRDDLTGKLSLELDPATVKDEHRHGYINGLSPENRQSLYEILDKVKADSSDPAERVEVMRQKVEELEQDPRNLHLTRYLKAEMVHIMNTYGIRPREYSIYESKVR